VSSGVCVWCDCQVINKYADLQETSESTGCQLDAGDDSHSDDDICQKLSPNIDDIFTSTDNVEGNGND